jgi:hypothetical protein
MSSTGLAGTVGTWSAIGTTSKTRIVHPSPRVHWSIFYERKGDSALPQFLAAGTFKETDHLAVDLQLSSYNYTNFLSINTSGQECE